MVAYSSVIFILFFAIVINSDYRKMIINDKRGKLDMEMTQPRLTFSVYEHQSSMYQRKLQFHSSTFIEFLSCEIKAVGGC